MVHLYWIWRERKPTLALNWRLWCMCVIQLRDTVPPCVQIVLRLLTSPQSLAGCSVKGGPAPGALSLRTQTGSAAPAAKTAAAFTLLQESFGLLKRKGQPKFWVAQRLEKQSWKRMERSRETRLVGLPGSRLLATPADRAAEEQCSVSVTLRGGNTVFSRSFSSRRQVSFPVLFLGFGINFLSITWLNKNKGCVPLSSTGPKWFCVKPMNNSLGSCYASS